MARLENIAEVFKALVDPVRLRILTLLPGAGLGSGDQPTGASGDGGRVT